MGIDGAVTDRQADAETARTGAYHERACPDPGLDQADREVLEALDAERRRQEDSVELIASENYVSQAVLDAVGSMATNKYAEGYPGKRYYGGCEHVDRLEQLAIDRAKRLYGADHVNVQTHAGSQANMAIYLAMLDPGDTILAMSLDQGGHLTHGFKLNYSGRLFNAVTYGVRRDNEQIDYDEVLKKAREHRPRLIIAGASAYPRVIDFDRFAAIAREAGALFMADIAHIAGAVATGHHPSPLPVADFVTATTHKTLRGPRGGLIMCRAAWARKVDAAVFPGMQGGPLMHVIAGKAVAFGEALSPSYKEYIEKVHANARALADELATLGHRIVTGGTDNHLMLVDLSAKNLTGAAASGALERAGITANKNLIPFDTRPPAETSGIRLGTPAMTTRCLGPDEMRAIARLIDRVLGNLDDENVVGAVRRETLALCRQFPIPSVHRLGGYGI